MEELKPCPCCKLPVAHYLEHKFPSSFHKDGVYTGQYEIGCMDCDLIMRDSSLKTLAMKWNRRVSPWVKVEDGLPKNGQQVLVCLELCWSEYAEICSAYYLEKKKAFNVLFDCGKKIYLDDILYWMPIPEIEG